MSSQSSPTDSQMDEIWETISEIPESISTDIMELISEEHIKTKAEAEVLEAFGNAAAAVVALPSYKALKEGATAPLHCVRCHDTFTEAENDSDSCVIPHVFSECTSYGSAGGAGGACYEAKCCGVTLEEDEAGGCDWLNLKDLGKHYQGYHTEYVKEVERDRTGGYNNVNIPRCKFEDGECVAHSYGGEEDPVFDC